MEIEKNIPLPESAIKSGRPLLRPFDKMEPGDSIFFPGQKTGGRDHDAMKKYGRRNPQKQFIARTYPDGMRIWRVV